LRKIVLIIVYSVILKYSENSNARIAEV